MTHCIIFYGVIASRCFIFFASLAALTPGASSTPTTPAPVLAAPASPHAHLAGLELGSFTVGRTTYHGVRVRLRDARSLLFSHRDGLGSVRLADLPPDIQARLDYDPASAPPEPSPPPRRAPVPRLAPTELAPGADQSAAPARLVELVRAFPRPPELRTEQTLQPQFIALNLAAKNQGRRPSCAIYAVVSALEFQNSRLVGGLEKLSEEYLIWATRSVLGQTETPAAPRDDAGEPAGDIGYSLPAVLSALHTYGVPLQDDMPNHPGLAAEAVPPPPDELIVRARARRTVFIAPLPSSSPEARLAALVHALNAGYPVPAGLRWPHERSISGGVLSGQRPISGAGHAVTFVGYVCPTGRIEEASFVFKNSYGPRWGQGGYGRATATYLARHLLDAYVLDVSLPEARP